MWYFLKYIRHYLISNSRHGTHSPFVYALADQAIYNKSFQSNHLVKYPEGFNPKYKTLLNKILSYWKIERLSDDLEDLNAQAVWIKDIQQYELETLLQAIRAGKMLIIDQPHKRKHFKPWKALWQQEEVIVSIDLFSFGILLHRNGQRKEHFLLRS